MTEAEFRLANPGLLEKLARLSAVQQIELAGWLESGQVRPPDHGTGDLLDIAQCKAVNTTGKHKGDPCRRRAQGNPAEGWTSDFCWRHDPARTVVHDGGAA